MASEQLDEKAIFNVARQILSPDARGEYLQQVCGADENLRARVSTLLRAYQEQASFLESPPAGGVVAATLAPPSSEKPGTQIGPYKLLQQIGEGGMGTVYMAEQSHPVQRKVALKVIKAGMDNGQVIARFEAERQALALMDHPNIAKVLDAGTIGESSRPYFVMELVKGVPITTYCDENHLSPKARLELFTQVCQAVQHAHQKGIIHRDLKPTNVLVTQYDGQPVPKVIDFGVNKATGAKLTERTLFTEFGQVVGTLEYMSPEQAETNQLDVDTRSDIYSLGVLLYELLTGTTPLDRKQMKAVALLEVLRLIREEEPPKPSTRLSTGDGQASIAANRNMEPKKLSGLVRGELDWIVMKALEKDRNRRYETANGFAQDVQRYLNDEAVLACPPSAAYRFRKFARRNKAGLAMAGVVFSALLFATIGLAVSNVLVRAERNEKIQALGQKEKALGEKQAALGAKEVALTQARANYMEAKRQEGLAQTSAEHAQQQQRVAQEQEGLARRRFYAAQMNLAQQAWDAGDAPRVLELLEGQRPRFDEEDLRNFEWYYLWRLCHVGHRPTIRSPTPGICSVAFSPDGKILARGSAGGTLDLWDASTGLKRSHFKSFRYGFQEVAFSPDGKTIAQGAGPTGDEVTLWNISTGQPTILTGAGMPRCLAFSPDEKTLATGSESKPVVKLWDIPTRRVVATLDCVGTNVLSVTFSPDGKLLATSTGWSHTRGRVTVWDLAKSPPQIVRKFPLASEVIFRSDGKTLATGPEKPTLWDLETGKVLFRYPPTVSAPNRMTLSRDGKLLALGTSNRSVTVWEPETGRLRSFALLKNVDSLAFAPDGKVLAAASCDGAVKRLDLAPPTPEPVTATHGAALGDGASYLTPLVFTPDSKTLVTSARDGTVKVWDARLGLAQMTFRGPSGGFGSVAVSPDGKLLAAARGIWHAKTPGEVKVWDLVSQQEMMSFVCEPGPTWSVAFSPDGKTLASGGQNGPLQLWDVETRKLRIAVNLSDWHKRLAFAPDGRTLAGGGAWGLVRLYDPATGREKATFTEPVGTFKNAGAFTYSPGGKLLAIGDTNGNVRLRDADTLEVRGSFRGHTEEISSLMFFPDGKTLASGSSDGTVKLWDIATGQERLTFKGGPYLAVAPDGLTLAIANLNGTVQLCRAGTDDEARARRTELDPDDPDSPAGLLDAAARLIAAGRTEEANQAYQKASARLRNLMEASPNRADYQQGWEAALTAYRLTIAKHYARSAQWAEARAEYTKAIELSPNDWAGWSGRAFVYFKQQQWDAAVADFSQAIELAPYVHTNWWHRGHAYRALAQWEKSAADFGKAVEGWPNGFEGWYWRSVAFVQLGQLDQAMADLQQAVARGFPNVEQIKDDPRLASLRTREDFGMLLKESGQNQKSKEQPQEVATDRESVLRQAIRIQPYDTDLHRELGLLLYDRGQFAEAESCFRELVRLEPYLADGHLILSNALHQQKKFGEQITALREASRLDPTRPWTHDTLGWVLIRQQQFPEAEGEFREAVRLKPDLASSHFGLGQALQQQKKSAEALAPLREAIRLEPTTWAHDTLGWTLVELQQFSEAEAAFRERLRLTPDLAAGHFALGRALVEQKKFADAEAALREAIRLEPTHPWAHQLLGRALQGQGKSAEAEEALKKHTEQKLHESQAEGETTMIPDLGT